MRTVQTARATDETSISLTLDLDGSGLYDIDTGCGFLNHMLELFTRHGRFNLNLRCTGDVQVDYHHTVEDIAIVLGRAFSEALGDRAGINRYGDITLPMDEALILAAVDISGRAHLGYALEIPTEKVGDFDTELVEEFLSGFARSLGASIHVRQLAGKNSHHIIEGMFKALARAMKQAVAIDPAYADEIPSTKGTIL
ncbi:MAG: imidazoleglycerol-phosphate dehydratase HisB [Clostridia bacterium]|jgi:imidazoleglycerol-phosphate dehydratase|nr:imidazoleglycerol-phosphate dehydratase HisB [Clostridia bacterium]NLS84942.1 imidazoleglycerol-phosphate dehydratase HisB [Oscillospiraceae bacterium]